jgi:hypothetical protein
VGIKNIGVVCKKHEKIEKVTSSQDDDSVGEPEENSGRERRVCEKFGLKRVTRVATLSRSAKALLPPHKCGAHTND